MISIAEQIYELVKSLPPEQASEVLSFAESLYARHTIAHQADKAEASDTWTELVDALAGTWKDDFPSLQAIRASSGEDAMRESL